MNVDVLREYALQLPGTEEALPFGPNALVFKVKGKMFLLIALDAEPLQFNAKCDPDEAIALREQYPHSVLTRLSYEQKTLEHDYCGWHDINAADTPVY